MFFPRLGRVGLTTPDKGVSDMTSIPDIDETGINRNLKVRYERDEIYVSINCKYFSSSEVLKGIKILMFLMFNVILAQNSNNNMIETSPPKTFFFI